MEFMQSKIPFLPMGWTVARGVKYTIKLGGFILVPGLHQMVCKRWILGGLLFVLYMTSGFIVASLPFDVWVKEKDFGSIHLNLVVIAQGATWFLLVVDLGKLENRIFRAWHILPVSLVVVLQFLPFHNHGKVLFLVETENHACPVFCKFDIVQYEINSETDGSINAGDHAVISRERIFIPSSNTELHVTRILAGPKRGKCEEDDNLVSYPPYEDFCSDERSYFPYDFVILGEQNPNFKSINNASVSLIEKFQVLGVRPEKIGNTHAYFLFTDDISDFVGNALLELYMWTGLNFLGHSSSPEYPISANSRKHSLQWHGRDAQTTKSDLKSDLASRLAGSPHFKNKRNIQ